MAYSFIRFCQKYFFPADNKNANYLSMGEEPFDKWRRIYDVPYGKDFPNSFLDLYLQRDRTAKATVFYVHGGGFTWGSKTDGDPTAGRKKTDKDWYFKRFLTEGYNMVSVDYAFAPEYGYPTPILQMEQAVQFLLEHGMKYGLDMTRLILAGSSAGGQIIGQFANVQTNAAYATEMGIPKILPDGSIKACLFNSALLDCTRYGEAHNPLYDYLFTKCGEAYFSDKNLKNHSLAAQSDVIRHASAAFPPSFLSDGNRGSFFSQARDFDRRLTELGVVHELNIYPETEAKLSHGYESINGPYGQDNMKKMLAFLQKQDL
ncbi:MAG TPA: alpha/beta hydrolase [Clostridiales bacterium]|nr:alpha/beta hydrolase [Clostridiales bacterium]